MKKNYILLTAIAVLGFSASAQWTEVTTGLASGHKIQGVGFTPNGTGYFATENTTYNQGVFHTSIDSGNTWTLYSPAPTVTKTYYLAYVKNDTTVFITGNNACLQRLQNGLWTTVIADAGSGGYNTWDMSFTPPIDTSSVGWLVGDAGTLKKTIDGGTTWATQTVAEMGTTILRKIKIFDKDTIVIVGDAGKVFRTIDGGTTWTISTSNTTDMIRGLSFVDNLNGWAVGNNSSVIHTLDGGKTWVKLSGLPVASKTLREVWFVNENKGFITGDLSGYIWMTEDGGTTWTAKWIATNISTKAIWFKDEVTGYIAAIGNKLYKTTSGGNVPALEAPASIVLTETENSNANVSLTATGYWTAKSSESWLVISDTVGTLSKTIVATATSATAVTRMATITFKSPGLADKVVNVEQQSTVAIDKVGAENISISPNPANGFIQIKNLPSANCTVALYDISGKLVLAKSLNDVNAVIDVTTLSTGAYVIEIANNSNVVKKQKLMIK